MIEIMIEMCHSLGIWRFLMESEIKCRRWPTSWQVDGHSSSSSFLIFHYPPPTHPPTHHGETGRRRFRLKLMKRMWIRLDAIDEVSWHTHTHARARRDGGEMTECWINIVANELVKKKKIKIQMIVSNFAFLFSSRLRAGAAVKCSSRWLIPLNRGIRHDSMTARSRRGGVEGGEGWQGPSNPPLTRHWKLVDEKSAMKCSQMQNWITRKKEWKEEEEKN